MTNQTSEIEDQDLWPDARLAQAEVEIAAEKKRRADAAAASKAAELSPAEREAKAMRELGEMDAVEARRKLKQLYGFDPAWR
jgi:hypothetical protein